MPAPRPEKDWVKRSNEYTMMLLDVQIKHSPEQGSAQGLAQYDAAITDGTRSDEIAQRKQLEEVLAKLKAAEATEKDRDVREDLEILQKAYSLQFRRDDYQLAHKVQFIDASLAVFGGLRTLLDDRVSPERRAAAVARLRKYAGVEQGYKPFTEVLKQRTMEQMAKPGVVYPAAGEIEAQLSQDSKIIEGISTLFRKYRMSGWEEPYAKLSAELIDYDTWVRETVLPRERKDNQMQPEEYALALEGYGVDLPPAQLAAEGHRAFTECQAEMAPLAAQVAKSHGWSATGYRDVLRELKKSQLTGDAVLPFYKTRLKAIEDMIVANKIVTLPSAPVSLVQANAAESAQQPAPHLVPPPLVNNTGQTGVFVLPMNVALAEGDPADKYDDFTFDAAAWPQTADEARPGRELQFESMVEHGVSFARGLYAQNATNTEGWGLYSEWVMQPYEPLDGQLATLQQKLLRAARAFLDTELQSGKVTPADAYKLLTNDVVLSPLYASEEVERYTHRAPGQATSYYFSYTKLVNLRRETQAALGKKFDQKKYHDFVLAQGLLPPDLLRKAVMEDFVPGQKK